MGQSFRDATPDDATDLLKTVNEQSRAGDPQKDDFWGGSAPEM